MPVTCAETEERVLEACEELETQEKPNIAKTAREFDVPVGRLRHRFQGKAPCRLDVRGQNKVLNKAAEEALCSYINKADAIGLLIRKQTLISAANAIY
jgi:hypothetical protein